MSGKEWDVTLKFYETKIQSHSKGMGRILLMPDI